LVARADSMSTSPIGRAFDVGEPATIRANGVAAPRSSTLPHAWHSEHLPTHLANSDPHSAQR
jgi:hypothetical protein